MVTPYQCLQPNSTIDVSVSDGQYLFDNVPYNAGTTIGVRNGTYTFTNLPSTHPFGFDSGILVTSGTTTNSKLIDGQSVDFYTGTITFEVSGDFGNQVSFHCYNHSEMSRKIEYAETRCTPYTPPSLTYGPTSSPTTSSPTTSLPTPSPTTSPTTSQPTFLLVDVDLDTEDGDLLINDENNDTDIEADEIETTCNDDDPNENCTEVCLSDETECDFDASRRYQRIS
jgi:hypothetical protein